VGGQQSSPPADGNSQGKAQALPGPGGIRLASLIPGKEAEGVKKAERADSEAQAALLAAQSNGDAAAVEQAQRGVDATQARLAEAQEGAGGSAGPSSWHAVRERLGEMGLGDETDRTHCSAASSVASHASAYVSPSRLRDWAGRGGEARHPTRSKVYPSKAAERAANQGIIVKDGGRLMPLFDLEPQKLDLPVERIDTGGTPS